MKKSMRFVSLALDDMMKDDMPDDKKKSGMPMSDIQIFKAGVFSYYEPGDMTMSTEMFKCMVVNFQNKVRGTDLAMDYGHNSYAEAAGWIKDVYCSEDGTELRAKVEWTKKAQEMIADKQYRYISGEFSYEYENEKGIKCGPTLWGAALTNRPFLKDMEPVIDMSEKNKESIQMHEQVKKLAEENEKFKVQLSEKDTEISKLKETIELSEKKAAEEKRTNAFNEMLKVGKVCEAQREAYMCNDVVKFSELAKPVNLNAAGSAEEPTPAAATEMTRDQAIEKVVELAEVKVKENPELNFKQAISEVLNENEDLAKKYNQ